MHGRQYLLGSNEPRRHQKRYRIRDDAGPHRQLPRQFTVHLDKHVLSGGTFHIGGIQNRATVHLMDPLGNHPGQISQIGHRLRTPKENNLKIRPEERSTASNLQIASVVAHPADQRKARLVLRAVNNHGKLSQRSKHLAETSHIIGKLPCSCFQGRAHASDNARV